MSNLITQYVKNEVINLLENIPGDFAGNCPQEKALILMELILQENMKYTIEIGVYRGRSFFPQAIAHKYTCGKVIGIDPYTKEAAREKDLPEDTKKMVDDFIASWDTLHTYILNQKIILQKNLGNNACIIRDKSENVAPYLFDGADMLHIDGNHDIEFVTKDILLYVPKVRTNGYIVLDDTDWDSVKSCLHLLTGTCTLFQDFGNWQIWKKN